MFLIYGTKKARIKKYTDNHNACESCKKFDLGVKVYRNYYHLYFVPFIPIGDKTAYIRCNNCGEPSQSGSLLQQYEKKAKTPFYLFSIPILLVSFFGFLMIVYANTQKEKAVFVASPVVGDVYRMRSEENDKTTYYFLRVNGINGDTVICLHSNLEYQKFTSVFYEEDYFVKNDELLILKSGLKQMLENGEIDAVNRSYGEYEGFDRIK